MNITLDIIIHAQIWLKIHFQIDKKIFPWKYLKNSSQQTKHTYSFELT